MRRTFVVFTLAALALTGCEADVDVGPGAQSPTPAPTDTGPFTPTEELGDCADVTATEGAPAPVTMMDNFFEPPCIAVSSTQSLILTNAGNQLHNLSVDGGDVDIDVEPGEEAETGEIGSDLAAGTYRSFCEYHEQQGMVGTIVVE